VNSGVRPRMLLISWHPPGSDAIGAQRVRSFVQHLPSMGWRVELITREVGDSSGDVRAAHVKVHVVRDPVADWRARADTGHGWLRVLSGVVRRGAIPDEQVWWSARAWRLAGSLNPDVVLVSGPPFSPWLAAAWIARACKAPLVCDYRDLWTQSHYSKPDGPKAMLSRRLERWTWRKMTRSTTVSQPLAAELYRGSGRKSAVVMNGFEFYSDPPLPVEREAPLQILHSGHLYGEKRDPSALFVAARMSGLGPDKLKIVFVGPDQDWVARRAQRLGVERLVTVMRQVTRDEALRMQTEADILLLLLQNDPAEIGVYSGKLFDYVATRRPVLMVGYEYGVAARLIQERTLGMVSNNPEEIAAMLKEWVQLKRSGGLSLVPKSASTGLTREHQARTLSDVLKELV
jgi:hypothetical protein